MRIDQFKARKIHFAGEQDGPPEQLLKRQLSEYLSCEREISSAYLVRLSYDADSSRKAALCLVGEATNARQIAESVETIFKALFRDSESLDILFLNDLQQREVNLVAKPFYKADGQEHCRPN